MNKDNNQQSECSSDNISSIEIQPTDTKGDTQEIISSNESNTIKPKKKKRKADQGEKTGIIDDGLEQSTNNSSNDLNKDFNKRYIIDLERKIKMMLEYNEDLEKKIYKQNKIEEENHQLKSELIKFQLFKKLGYKFINEQHHHIQNHDNYTFICSNPYCIANIASLTELQFAYNKLKVENNNLRNENINLKYANNNK